MIHTGNAYELFYGVTSLTMRSRVQKAMALMQIWQEQKPLRYQNRHHTEVYEQAGSCNASKTPSSPTEPKTKEAWQGITYTPSALLVAPAGTAAGSLLLTLCLPLLLPLAKQDPINNVRSSHVFYIKHSTAQIGDLATILSPSIVIICIHL